MQVLISECRVTWRRCGSLATRSPDLDDGTFLGKQCCSLKTSRSGMPSSAAIMLSTGAALSQLSQRRLRSNNLRFEWRIGHHLNDELKMRIHLSCGASSPLIILKKDSRLVPSESRISSFRSAAADPTMGNCECSGIRNSQILHISCARRFIRTIFVAGANFLAPLRKSTFRWVVMLRGAFLVRD